MLSKVKFIAGIFLVIIFITQCSNNSNPVSPPSTNHTWDFWPSGNGVIKMEITEYVEGSIRSLDPFDCGDPYFIISFTSTWNSNTDTTGYYENTCQLLDQHIGFSFDVPDSLQNFSVSFDVWDYDAGSANDHIDIWPEAPFGGVQVNLNTKTNTFPYIRTYNGEDDGRDENDASITVKVSLIERYWKSSDNIITSH